MLAIEPPRIGREYLWLIQDLMSKPSSDVDPSRGRDRWSELLNDLRYDGHYPDVIMSIKDYGFIRPLDADIERGEVRLSDGHHRLAVSIDLGFEAVPVLVSEYPSISDDSGTWYLDEPVCDRAGTNQQPAWWSH